MYHMLVLSNATSHYFIESPELLTRERELSLEIFGRRLKFFTNNGLFSCDKIDEASLTLVKTMPELSGTFLDLGCGYGVIGITLAAKNSIALTCSDINRIALDYAKKNAERNSVSANFIHSDGFAEISGGFDNIALNPPIHAGKEIVYRLYEEAATRLNPGGSFFIVIQKKHGAESTIRKLGELFPRVEVLYRKKGCFVVRAYA